MHIRIHTYMCVHIHMVHLYIYIYIYVCMCIHMYASASACLCTYLICLATYLSTYLIFITTWSTSLVGMQPRPGQCPRPRVWQFREIWGQIRATLDSKKLEYGPGTIYGGVPCFLSFGIGGQSYANFLASPVCWDFQNLRLMVHILHDLTQTSYTEVPEL